MPDRSLTYSRAGASPMPSQPAWFHRLDEILSGLRPMTSTHLDRLAVMARRAERTLGNIQNGSVNGAQSDQSKRNARRSRRERPEWTPSVHECASQHAGLDPGIPRGDDHSERTSSTTVLASSVPSSSATSSGVRSAAPSKRIVRSTSPTTKQRVSAVQSQKLVFSETRTRSAAREPRSGITS